MTIYVSHKRCLPTEIRGEFSGCISFPTPALVSKPAAARCRSFTFGNVVQLAWNLNALVKLRLGVDITSTEVCDRISAILVCDCADMNDASLRQDDEVVPDEQSEALSEYCAKTVWFDDEDPGFAKAGSIKVSLQMKHSPFKNVLGNWRKDPVGKRLVRSAGLLFVVLRAMSESTYRRRWDWDVDNVRSFMGYSLGITS